MLDSCEYSRLNQLVVINLFNRCLELIHFAIHTCFYHFCILVEIISLEKLQRWKLASQHLDRYQKPQDSLFVLYAIFVAETKGLAKFSPCFLKTVVVHVIPTLVVGNLDLPVFGEVVEVDVLFAL